MKNFILILMLLFTCNIFSQLAPPKKYQKIDLHLGMQKQYYNQKHTPVGPFMMLGGGVMALAGFLTVPPYEATSTQPKPFFKQGGRMISIMSGGAVFLVGTTITIAGH